MAMFVNPTLLFTDLEEVSEQLRLANDAQHRTAPNLVVERNRNSDTCVLRTFLHNAMAASSPNCEKSILLENSTDLTSRKDTELTQPIPRPESQIFRCETGVRFQTSRPFQKTT